jgi:hypothetical protein
MRAALTLIILIAGIILLVPSFTTTLPPGWGKVLPKEKIHLGLDLQGGRISARGGPRFPDLFRTGPDVVDRRAHQGGNVHDHSHPSGIRIHTYGPHYFRTSNPALIIL